jgi:hypothetical protein
MPPGGKSKGRRSKADLDLRDFSPVGPRLHSSAAAYYGTSASYCLRQHRAKGAILLRYTDTKSEKTLSVHALPITRAVRATFNDLQDATEHGAYGVALLTAARELGATLAERSWKGPGLDFHLHPPGHEASVDPDDIFSGTWALEVSGLLQGTAADVDGRLRQKKKQVASAAKMQPTLVAIVECSEPSTTLELQ